MFKFKYDIFISHASEDKHLIALPLATLLKAKNIKVWIDEDQLKLGDSLWSSINQGLKESRYGLVILSHNFFKKHWTITEMEGLFSKEEIIGKVIIPIWHNIDKKEIMNYSPILASRLAVSTHDGLDYVTNKILNAIGKKDTEWHRKKIQTSIRDILTRKGFISESEYIYLFQEINRDQHIDFTQYNQELKTYITTQVNESNFEEFKKNNEKLYASIINNIDSIKLSRLLNTTEKRETPETRLLFLITSLINEYHTNKIIYRDNEIKKIVLDAKNIIYKNSTPEIFKKIFQWLS